MVSSKKNQLSMCRDYCKNFTEQYLRSLSNNVFNAINFLRKTNEVFLVEQVQEHLEDIYTNQRNYLFSLFDKFGNVKITRLGDVHRKGRCTVMVESQTNRFIYKPIDSGLLITLNNVLTLLNETSAFDFYIIRILENKKNYSVIEFIENEVTYDVENFSYHYGALLLIITLLRGIDFHYENIFSVKSTPVVIDCESLFYPSLKNTKRYDAYATSMIPTERNNISIMSKYKINIHDLIKGIDDASSSVKNIKDELIKIIGEDVKKSKRIIFKPTKFYYEILSKSLHPAFLVEQYKRKNFLEKCLSGKHAISQCSMNNEVKDLMRFDIPYFSCVKDQLFGSDGEKIKQNFCVDDVAKDICLNIDNIDEFKGRIIEKVK